MSHILVSWLMPFFWHSGRVLFRYIGMTSMVFLFWSMPLTFDQFGTTTILALNCLVPQVESMSLIVQNDVFTKSEVYRGGAYESWFVTSYCKEVWRPISMQKCRRSLTSPGHIHWILPLQWRGGASCFLASTTNMYIFKHAFSSSLMSSLF